MAQLNVAPAAANPRVRTIVGSPPAAISRTTIGTPTASAQSHGRLRPTRHDPDRDADEDRDREECQMTASEAHG